MMGSQTKELIAVSGLLPAAIAKSLQVAPFQGRQIFRWIHQRQVFDFAAMTDLSKVMRDTLAETCVASQLELVSVSRSAGRQGTKKALFRMVDGETVESVLIRDRRRLTLCLSSQVGCAVKCTFCATGASGYTRDLSPGEIVEQALYLLGDEAQDGRTPNIVFMGMGEPFRNYESVAAGIRLLMAKDGLGIGARKITVSTVGDVPGIRRFAEEDWQVRLSVSLHSANDVLRSELVPLNRKYPLAELMAALEGYMQEVGRLITFEWTLLQGVNDSPRDVQELVGWARALRAHVNLIPYNPVEGLGYAPPDRATCERFRDGLVQAGVKTTLRKPCGQDIDAACGQLRRRHLDPDGS